MIGIPGGAVAQVALGAKVGAIGGAIGTMGWYCGPDLKVSATGEMLLVCCLCEE